MKPAVPWSIKGVEPEAREAAKIAARRSGMTLGEWLNTVILESDEYDPEPAYRPPHRAAMRHEPPRYGSDVHDRLDELSAQISRIARSQSATAVSRVVEPKIDLDPLSDLVRGLVDRVERSEKRSIESMDEFDRRLNRLSDKLLDDIARRSSESAGASAGTEPFERALKNIVDHIEQVERRNGDAFKAVHNKIDDLAQQFRNRPVESRQPDVTGLERQLGQLAERIDRMERRGEENGAVKAIEQRVSSLAEQLRENAKTVSIMARARDTAPKIDTSEFVSRNELLKIQSRIEDIVNKLEDPIFGNPDDAIEQVREEIATLSRNLADVRIEAASIKDVQTLRQTIDNISAQLVDGTGYGDADDESVALMQQQIAELSRSIADMGAGVPSIHDVEEVRDGLRQVAEQIQYLQVAGIGADTSQLQNEISSINGMIEQIREEAASIDDIHALRAALEHLSGELGPGDSERYAALQERIDELARQVEHSGGGGDARQIAMLEERLQDLYTRMETGPAPTNDDAYRSLETHVATLFDRLSAIEERGSGGGDGSEGGAHYGNAVETLERSLETVQANAARNDQRTQETLEAVHETLEKVVNRLARLEEAASMPAIPDFDLRPADDERPEAVEQPIREQAQTPRPPEDNLRLPPIIGLDDIRPQAGTVQSTLEAPPAAPRAGRTDDFIAAARRAAQAAPQPAAAEPKKRSPLLNFLSRKSKGRKDKEAKSTKMRTVLLAAAVALLAIGALSTMPLMTGKTGKQILGSGGGEVGPKASRLAPPSVSGPAEQARPEIERTFDKPINPQSLPTATGTRRPRAGDGAPAGVTEVAKTSADHAPAAGMPETAAIPAADPIVTGSIPRTPGEAPTSGDRGSFKASDSLMTAGAGSPRRTEIASVDPTAKLSDRAPAPSTASEEALPPAEIGPMSLRIAAASGSPAAQFEVAARYTEGRIIAQDFRKAAMWYQRAAAKGLAPAQYRLGTLYEKGRGVPQDKAAARIWYERAAEKGNRKAMHNLAVAYADASDGKPNYVKAAMWFHSAAELGLADSQYNYAILAERGLGVRADPKEAYRWFSIAKRSGDRGAEERMAALEKQLDAADLVTIRLQVESWKPKTLNADANVVEIPSGGWGGTSQTEEPARPATSASAPPMNHKMIIEVQTLLNNMGYRVGTADGVLGPRTREAIRDFERDQGLAPTGMVTRGLVERLNAQPG